MQNYSYRWGGGGRTEAWCHSAVEIINLGKGGICKIVSLCRDFVIRSPSSSSLAVRPGTGFGLHVHTVLHSSLFVGRSPQTTQTELGGLSVLHFPAERSLGQEKMHYKKKYRQARVPVLGVPCLCSCCLQRFLASLDGL